MSEPDSTTTDTTDSTTQSSAQMPPLPPYAKADCGWDETDDGKAVRYFDITGYPELPQSAGAGYRVVGVSLDGEQYADGSESLSIVIDAPGVTLTSAQARLVSANLTASADRLDGITAVQALTATDTTDSAATLCFTSLKAPSWADKHTEEEGGIYWTLDATTEVHELGDFADEPPPRVQVRASASTRLRIGDDGLMLLQHEPAHVTVGPCLFSIEQARNLAAAIDEVCDVVEGAQR